MSNHISGHSNSQITLTNILNTMYNDNIRQIRELNETNNQIRQALIQLYTNQPLQPSNNTSTSTSTSATTTQRRNSRQPTEMVYTFATANNLTDSLLGDITRIYDLSTQVNGQTNNRRQDEFNFLSSLFTPITIHPSAAQIEVATRNIRYGDIATPLNTQCPISTDDFRPDDIVTVINHCGHIFSKDLLASWFRGNCRCPVCRYDIRDENLNAPLSI